MTSLYMIFRRHIDLQWPLSEETPTLEIGLQQQYDGQPALGPDRLDLTQDYSQ